jgi:hemerythrin superfamily protein
MAKSGRKTRRRTAAAPARRKRRESNNAIALLQSDHREVEGWFARFLATHSAASKLELARKICAALRAHTTIEEEIFYPAFLEATGERSMHHEAEIEHSAATRLIAEIERSGHDDDYFNARVEVLSEMVKHHVKGEEKRGGMFSRARRSGMDLAELGQKLKRRKDELTRSEPAPAVGTWLLTP